MAGKPFNLEPFLFLFKIFLSKTWNKSCYQEKPCISNASKPEFNMSLAEQDLNPNKSSVFHMEGVLLKSCSVFPYFMLVAFEAGGPLRAFVLLLLYPLLCLVGRKIGMKIMVFVSFVGLKEETFRIGSTVLPKFFLEDIGNEGFDMVMKYSGRKIGVSEMPRVMVERFLRDYLRVEDVVGKELKLISGHFTGLMEEKNTAFGDVFSSSDIGLCCFKNQKLFSLCEVVYLVNEGEKRNWEALPREKYPRELIFHDGRLAFRPTPIATLFMFMWIPIGLLLMVIRTLAGLLLPYKLSVPILCFTGITGTSSGLNLLDTKGKQRGALFVCNHRTLLDPIYLSFSLARSVTAVTYSISWITELVSPIKTVRLTRNREKDSKLVEQELRQGDLVICPEGTTCREPYLLRFSPLFAEITKEIVPVALDFQVSMFYGTTATGFKVLDPVFLLMNPSTHCSGTFLGRLPESETCQVGGRSKFEVANHVQGEIAKALGFKCTTLTRKDKYKLLAGNEGLMIK
ncbi:hypothetical protein SLE2022_140500 [Rubroshorea leprosula]